MMYKDKKMQHPVGYLLDTNIFNRILDGDFSLKMLPKGQYYCTILQETELRRNSEVQRRAQLLKIFQTVGKNTKATQMPPYSTPWGAPWGSPWHQGGIYYPEILKAFGAGSKTIRKNRGNKFDALTIEICKYENLCLITGDEIAAKIAKQFDVQVKFISRT